MELKLSDMNQEFLSFPLDCKIKKKPLDKLCN